MSDPWQDDVPQGRFDLAQLRRLWPFVRPYRREFACCLLILVVSFLLELAGPMLVQWAIDGPLANTAAAAPDRLRALVLACAGFLAVTGLGAVLGYRYGMLTAWNGQRVIRDVRSFLFTHLLHVGPSFHERNPAGKLTTRVSSDVENLNELIATGVLQSVFDLLKIGGVLVALFLPFTVSPLYTIGALLLMLFMLSRTIANYHLIR